MKQEPIRSKLEGLNIDLGMVNLEVKNGIILLYNLIEGLSSTNRALQIENQKLRDENNILKGEQSKPDIKPNTTSGKNKNKDISSEKERKGGDEEKENAKNKESKIEKIKIDRIAICKVDKGSLPPDAEFKG
ncbi:MAG: hypothetical protein HQL61_10205 [Magnetococcales bacterium]|nr:hypothetical protein [Nitrospirota bacterium]